MTNRTITTRLARLTALALIVAVVTLSVTTTARAHGCSYETQHCSQSRMSLPTGAVVWEYSEFDKWLSSAELSDAERQQLGILRETEDPMPLLFTSVADYEAWLSSLDPQVAAMVEESSVKVKGSDLPPSISVSGAEPEILSLATGGEDEYVIVPSALTFCYVCGLFVSALVGWALGRWVFDPIADWLIIKWQEWIKCPDNHVIEQTECTDYSSCPYAPWCLGTWQRVISGGSISANCECECGATWVAYNPLY
jgi:hypothetical protein